MATLIQSAAASQSDRQPYAADALTGAGELASLLRLQIQRIAPHFRTALVTGERGVGKEAVARALHRLSAVNGSAGPFTAMDISVFAESGDAVDLHGVLFLKGLDRLEPALQEKLVGRLRGIQRETRILISSECDLRSMQATGRLRQSLAGRVGGLEIRVGALRDRLDDFDALAAAMLARSGSAGRFSDESLSVLRVHSWPGNLAELWDVVEQVRDVAGLITPLHLPALVSRRGADESGARLDQVMQRHVFEVLRRCSGNKLRAAEMLGISRSTLYRMLEAAGEEKAEPARAAALGRRATDEHEATL